MNSGNSATVGKRKPRRLVRPVRLALILIVLVTVMSWWTFLRMPGTSFRGELSAADEALVKLTGELRSDVDHLAVRIGERNARNRPDQLALAADYIEARLKATGHATRRQAYEVDGTTCFNVELEIPGTIRPEEIVVVGGHYDTVVGTAGANDNTSGVAAVLALARRLADGRNERTLRFVAFVNEEPPYFQTDQMGSRVYARRCRERGDRIVAMLSLDMIGCYDDKPGSQKYPPPFGLLYPSTGNFIGFIGNVGSRDLVRRAIGAFRKNEPFPSEGAAMPEAIPQVGFSDQWSFWQEGYPAIMVTDTAMFRFSEYHQAGDTIDKLDFDRMARVVRGLERTVADLAGGE